MFANPPRLLLIEDDRRLAHMLVAYLHQNGFQVQHADTAATGLQRLRTASTTQSFAIVLLDVMLPDTSGLDVCRQVRALAPPLDTIPIVMLTAKGDPMDRVVGLELGADDYLPKPFEPRELLARLRAVLRRPLATVSPPLLRFGEVEIDRDARTLRVNGGEVTVTSHQFNLLVALAERPGRVLSRDQLMDALKGRALDANDRSIDVHIGRLRAAIEDDPKHPRHIITVRGVGYCFARSQDVTA